MEKGKTLIITCMVLFLTCVVYTDCYSQLKYLGLKEKSNIREAQRIYAELYRRPFWPRTQVIDNYIYVPCATGLYRKNLEDIQDTSWELYAFEDVPLCDFVKNNDSILAATAYNRERLLLFSDDDGKTYTDRTSDFFFKYEDRDYIFRIDKNPDNPNSLVLLHAHYGVARSHNFGSTWFAMQEVGGGYQERFISYNPNDTTNIFYGGEFEYFAAYVYASYDDGITWDLVENTDNNCTHHLEFHPTNPDIILLAGEGLIKKSIDRGRTWTVKYTGENISDSYTYFTGIAYNEANPDIVYAAGALNGENNIFTIYSSRDGGESWNIFYQIRKEEFNDDFEGIMDIKFYKNKLYVYTLINGFYSLDLASVGGISRDISDEMKIYPNPVKNSLNLEMGDTPVRLDIIDMSGRNVLSVNPGNRNYAIDVSFIPAGIYLLKIKSINNTIVRKIIKE